MQPFSAAPQYDVVVCGGTLGIFYAVALAQRGLRVAVVEQGVLRGREQEWNISRKEMHELVEVSICMGLHGGMHAALASQHASATTCWSMRCTCSCVAS